MTIASFEGQTGRGFGRVDDTLAPDWPLSNGASFKLTTAVNLFLSLRIRVGPILT